MAFDRLDYFLFSTLRAFGFEFQFVSLLSLLYYDSVLYSVFLFS